MVLVKLFGDEQIVLNCMASDFSVKDGVMQARTFRLETDDTIIDITGQINLATERLDLDIRPENKTLRIFTLRSEEHTSELQSLMRISNAVLCLKKQNRKKK